MSVNIGDLYGQLILEDKFSAVLSQAEENLSSTSQYFDKLGSSLTSAGVAFLPVTAAIVGFGAGALKAGIDFESSFAGVKKTISATDEEFDAMSDALRQLATEIPVSVNELNHLAESAGAMGIQKENLIEFTRVMAELGATTNLSADEAATAIAQIQNIFGAAGQDTDKFAAALVALGNGIEGVAGAGAATEKQIVEMAANMAAAGSTAGMSQAQVLGFASAFASLGLEAEKGGSAFSKTISEISIAVSKGGEDLKIWADAAHMSSEAFASLFKQDAAAAFNAFIEGLARTKAEGQDLNLVLDDLGIKEIRQVDTMKRLAGAADMVAESVKYGSEQWVKGTAANEEFQKRLETTASQLQILWNKVYDVGIELGGALLPALKDLVSMFDSWIPTIKSAAEWFANLNRPTQEFMIAVAGLVAAIGPALIIFGQMATGFSAILKAGEFLAPMFSGLTQYITPIVEAVMSVVKVFSTWEGALTALGAVVEAIPIWGWIVGGVALAVTALITFTDSWDEVGNALQAVGRFFEGVYQLLKDLGTIALWAATEAFSTLWEWVKKVAEVVGDLGASIGRAIVSFGSDLIDTLIYPFKAAAEWVSTNFPSQVQAVFNAISSMWQTAKDIWNGFIDGVKDAIKFVHELAATIGDIKPPADPGPPTSWVTGTTAIADYTKMSKGAEDALAAVAEAEKLAGVQRANTQRLSEEATKAIEKHKQALADLTNELSGAKATATVHDWMTAVENAGGVVNLSTEGVKQFNDVLIKGIDAARRNGEATDVMRGYLVATTDAIKGLKVSLDGITWDNLTTKIDLAPMIADTEKATQAWQDLFQLMGNMKTSEDAAKALSHGLDNVAISSAKTADELKNLEILNDLSAAALKKSADQWRDMGSAIGELSSAIGGDAGGTISLIGDAFQSFGDMAERGGHAVTGFAAQATAAIQGVAAVWKATEADGSQAIWNGAIAGASSGAAFGAYGIAIGAAAGAITSAIRSTTVSFEEMQQAQQMVTDFQRSLSEEFERTATAADYIRAGTDNVAQGMDVLARSYLDFGITAEAVAHNAEALNARIKEGPAGVEAAIAILNNQLEKHRLIMADWADGVNTYTAGLTQRIDAFSQSMEGVTVATEGTQASFTRMSEYVIQAFGIVLSQSGNALTAIVAIQEPLNQLIELQKSLGLEGTATFQRLADVSAVINANQDVFNALEGLQQMMKGLAQATLLTSEDMQRFGMDAVAMFETLREREVDANLAMSLMQPTLQALWEHQQKFHDITDGATLALLAQAETAGIVGVQSRDINQQMLEAILGVKDGITQLVNEILRLPAAFQQAKANADALAAAMANIPSEIVNRGPTETGIYTGGTAVPREGFARGTGGQYLDFGAETIVALHGRERVMTEEEGRQESMRSSGLTVSVTLQGGTFIGSSREFQDSVMTAVNTALQRSGRATSEFVAVTKQLASR